MVTSRSPALVVVFFLVVARFFGEVVFFVVALFRLAVFDLVAAFFAGMGGNVLAHAFFPFSVETSGLAGDVHFDNSNFWSVGTTGGGIDIIEVMTHELGHSLGLDIKPASKRL